MNTSEQTIQSCLSNMSDIFRETAKSPLTEDANLQRLARLSHKLDAEDLPTKVQSAKDMANDSLEKVSFYIDLALDTFQSIQAPTLDSDQYANFIFALSETLETLGNYERALSNYEKALNSTNSSRDRSMQGKIQYRMARIYAEMGRWDEAHALLNEAIFSLQIAGDDKEVGLAQIELAKMAFRKGEYAKAQDIFQIALESAERANDIRARAIIGNNLGVIRRMEANYDSAYLHFQEALIEFQSVQDFRGAADTLNNLGMLYLRRNESGKAIESFDKALKTCQEIGYFPLLSFVYLNKTEYYCEAGDYAMAANTCARALENLTRLKNPIGIAKTTLLFGRIFWKSGDVQTARKFYNESIRLYKSFDIPFGLANCYLEFSEMLASCDLAEESEKFGSQAQVILDRLRKENASDEAPTKTTVIE